MTTCPTIIVDTREQRPWRFSSRVQVKRATVPTGADYTVEGCEDCIGIERKSLPDLVGSLTVGRERFMRSLAALVTRRWRAVIVETPLSAVLAGLYRSRVKPTAILRSICAICADGTPVLFADDPGCAAQLAERLLLKFADRAERASAAESDPSDTSDHDEPKEAA